MHIHYFFKFLVEFGVILDFHGKNTSPVHFYLFSMETLFLKSVVMVFRTALIKHFEILHVIFVVFII